jgi:hypothetical protein
MIQMLKNPRLVLHGPAFNSQSCDLFMWLHIVFLSLSHTVGFSYSSFRGAASFFFFFKKVFMHETWTSIHKIYYIKKQYT